MARTVGVGHQDFETIRKENYFYIDKTEFIREWWERGDSVTLITRPRRFGKTPLEDTVASALAQIERMNYEAALTARGITGAHVRKYGFAFEGKKVLIGSSPQIHKV